MTAPVFLPGTGEPAIFPLGRYLPPVNKGTAVAWLKDNLPPGAWVLDPIGFTPLLALEAAQAGYHVLVSCNNPILSLMFEVLAAAPDKNEIQSALADLSLLKRGEERLDVHLKSLYQTICPSCKQGIQAQGYLWKRDDKEPYARLIRCPYCAEEGEYPLTDEDISRLTLPGNPALHRARAIERVSLQDDEIRPGVEEALRAYLPRPLYFITTLINKIEGGDFNNERRRLLWALVLSVCDEGNSLWPWPSGRNRPRQLSIAPQFRENNLWLSLESTVETWSSQTRPVPLTLWPELPPESANGGICLFRGRLKSLLPLPPSIQPQAAVTAFPRPSQAFWTLSAVWSGWLWGREAVQPLKAALDRLRYDWDWHATALHNTFETLFAHNPPDYPVFGIMPETVPGFLGALVLAAESGGFHLCGLSLREEDATTQFCLRRSGDEPASEKSVAFDPQTQSSPRVLIEKALIKFLETKQEPASYLALYAAALEGASGAGMFPQLSKDTSAKSSHLRYFSDLSNKFESHFHQDLHNQLIFRRFRGSEQNEESGVWWLHDPIQPAQIENDSQLPLTDRVEKEIVQYLQRNPKSRFEEVESALCQLFPGLLTPSEDFVRICLESYCVPITQDGNQRWQLRPEDDPGTRRRDLHNVQIALTTLANKLGFVCSGEMPLLWKTPSGEISYALFPLASSIISRWVFTARETPSNRSIIVLPGGRSRLLAFKLRSDPRLAEFVRGWHFLKFRMLRQLLEQRTLDSQNFDNWLDSDPPDLEESRQMSIFDVQESS